MRVCLGYYSDGGDGMCGGICVQKTLCMCCMCMLCMLYVMYVLGVLCVCVASVKSFHEQEIQM